MPAPLSKFTLARQLITRLIHQFKGEEGKQRGRRRKRGKENIQHPPLRSLGARIPNSINDPAGRPRSAEGTGQNGEAQARDEQGAEEGRQRLCEVGVGALG